MLFNLDLVEYKCMKLRTYLKINSICFVFSLLVLAICLFKNQKTLPVFYLSVFLAINTGWSLIEFIFRTRFKKRPLFLQIKIAFRHSFWLAILALGLLLLYRFQVFYLPNILLLLVILGLLESFFYLSDKRYSEIKL